MCVCVCVCVCSLPAVSHIAEGPHGLALSLEERDDTVDKVWKSDTV